MRVIWVRPILYGIIGLFIGAIGGVLLLSLLFPATNQQFLSLGLPLVGGLLGAYGLGSLGKKMSNMQAQSEKQKGYFWVCNIIVTLFLVFSVLVSFAIGFVAGVVPGLDVLFQSLVGTVIFTIVDNVIAMGLAVRFAAAKGYLLAHHTPERVAGIITSVYAVIGALLLVLFYLSADKPSFLGELFTTLVLTQGIGLIVMYVSAIYFIRRFKSVA